MSEKRRDQLEDGEYVTPVREYPWSSAARQVVDQVIDPIRSCVVAVLARPEANTIRIYALFSNEEYDHQVARALAELEVRLRALLRDRARSIWVEAMPSWAMDAQELESIRLRSIELA